MSDRQRPGSPPPVDVDAGRAREREYGDGTVTGPGRGDRRERRRHRAGETATPGSAGSTPGPVLARLSRPRTRTRTRFAVVADVHLSTRRAGTWRLFHRTERRLATVVEDCNARDVDAVFLAGDLTAGGRREDFERVHELLARLDPPAMAVPGNHDAPADAEYDVPSRSWFERRFAPGGLPFSTRVGDLGVVGLDTTAPTGAAGDPGEVSPGDLAWLDDRLSVTDAAVVLGHHALTPSVGGPDVPDWKPTFSVRDHVALAEILGRHDVALYLSGHLHLPATGATAGVREVVAPPLCSFPQGYLLVEVDDDGTVVRYVPAAGPDATAGAYLAARDDTPRSRALAETCADRMGSFPLVDER